MFSYIKILIKYFFLLNRKVSNFIEIKLIRNQKNIFQKSIKVKQAVIADFGGGRRPTLRRYPNFLDGESTVEYYYGFDVDEDELSKAPLNSYNETYRLDLNDTSSNEKLNEKFDVALCINVLEHVRDVNNAINIISRSLKPGGTLLLKLPCRHALFTKVNLLLPDKLGNSLLFFIYPNKIGTDGFKAFYDEATPNKIKKICSDNSLLLVSERKIYYNDIFSFFLPLYIVWRFITLIQYLVIEDYCESMEFIFQKQSEL